MAIDLATIPFASAPPRPPIAVPTQAATAPVGSVQTATRDSADAVGSRWGVRDVGAEFGGPEVQETEMSFWDFLDVINPLQHIPLVSDAYRALTGDEIKPAAEVAGGMLYGGVIGGMAAIANAVLEEATGRDLGGHMMATLGFGDDEAATGVAAGSAAPNGVMTAQAPAQAQAQNPRQAAAQTPAQTELQARRAEMARQRAAAAGQGGGQGGAAPAGMVPGGMPGAGSTGGGLSAALAGAAHPNQPSGREAAEETARAIAAAGHVPSKMPKRDAMLTTAMPRGSQTTTAAKLSTPQMPAPSLGPASAASGGEKTASTAAPAPASAPATSKVAADKPAPAKAAASSGRPSENQSAGNQPGAGPRDSMAEIMLRNLDKYRDIKRNEAAAPTMRTSI